MKRERKKTGNPSAENQSKKDPHPFAGHIQRLEELRQPWNPVVRASIDLLKCTEAPVYIDVEIEKFKYAQIIHADGQWKSQFLTSHAMSNAVGIILSGRAEVVTINDQSISNTSGPFSPARPRHLATIDRGAVLGSYEFTANVFQSPETHPYKVLSGPVCLQFDHPKFNVFRQNITKKNDSLIKHAIDEQEFTDWLRTGDNYHLISAFSSIDSREGSHAELIFIDLKRPGINLAEGFHCSWEAFRNALVEAAWLQSHSSRSRNFRDPSLENYKLTSNDDLKLIELESYKKTLMHLREVVQGSGYLWSKVEDAIEFPAIQDAISNMAKLPQPLNGANIYMKESLMQSPRGGLVSVIDSILRYRTKGAKGKWEDPLQENISSRGKTLTAAEALIKNLKCHVEADFPSEKQYSAGKAKERTLVPPALLPLTESDNPFCRLGIEVNPGLDTLPAITWIEDKIGSSLDLNGTLIVACQHFLRETCAWFAHLMSKGAIIIAIGKDYSTCPEVARRLQRIGVKVVETPTWEWKPGEYASHLEAKAKLAWVEASKMIEEDEFKEVIVVDDGGVLHKTANGFVGKYKKLKLCGVEQTTSGEVHAESESATYPVALVSRHKEKRKWESKIIAEKIYDNSLRQCAPLSGAGRIGIIGAGAIAAAVAEKFSDMGYTVFWFSDSEEFQLAGNKVNKKQTLEELLTETDFIFGCAGDDVLKKLLDDSDGQRSLVAGKWFISCSSSDTEFASLLKLKNDSTALCSPLRLHNPFSTMVVQTLPDPCFVLNGGFPINFDRGRDSVPLHLIQFTRALMHMGLIEARTISKTGVVQSDEVPWEELRTILGGKLVHQK